MSDVTPLAVIAVALGGAWILACFDGLVAHGRGGPLRSLRTTWATLRQPLQRPETYDNVLFHLAPGLLVVSAVTALAAVPWSPGFRGVDLDAGALLFGVAVAYVTPAVFMAGWGAGSPQAVLGGFRFVGLMLAYAMPVAMVLTAVAAPAGSLRPTDIVDAQHAVPNALVQPLALLVWLPSAMAVTFLPPFDLPQADDELGGGAFSLYRGLDAVLVRLAQLVLLLAVSGMTAALFLAGWHGPLLPDGLWMALKTLVVAVGILYAGRRVPRARIDTLLPMAWKWAIPLAIAAIVYAGLLTLVFYR